VNFPPNRVEANLRIELLFYQMIIVLYQQVLLEWIYRIHRRHLLFADCTIGVVRAAFLEFPSWFVVATSRKPA
jgi:hypothetical protein